MPQDINKDGRVSAWEAFPYWFDKLRIFPRIFISIYIYVFYDVVQWFMALEDPNMSQAGLVSVVTGAGAAWFGLYVNSGTNNSSPVVIQTQSNASGTTSSYQDSPDESEISSSRPSNFYR
jgi:hypothetical protein